MSPVRKPSYLRFLTSFASSTVASSVSNVDNVGLAVIMGVWSIQPPDHLFGDTGTSTFDSRMVCHTKPWAASQWFRLYSMHRGSPVQLLIR